MTYRERRERKAERLQEWAAKRDQKADALYARGDPYRGDIAFNTQPGHIPERARVIRATEKSFEERQVADKMYSRASGILDQLDHAIYSDDPDAIEQLTARIATLEAKREKIKSDNATFKAAHKEQLKALTPYGRDQAMPHQGYELTNLSADIRRNQKRLEELQNPRQRSIYARRAGICSACDHPIEPGTVITEIEPSVWVHGECAR